MLLSSKKAQLFIAYGSSLKYAIFLLDFLLDTSIPSIICVFLAKIVGVQVVLLVAQPVPPVCFFPFVTLKYWRFIFLCITQMLVYLQAVKESLGLYCQHYTTTVAFASFSFPTGSFETRVFLSKFVSETTERTAGCNRFYFPCWGLERRV